MFSFKVSSCTYDSGEIKHKYCFFFLLLFIILYLSLVLQDHSPILEIYCMDTTLPPVTNWQLLYNGMEFIFVYI